MIRGERILEIDWFMVDYCYCLILTLEKVGDNILKLWNWQMLHAPSKVTFRYDATRFKEIKLT